MASKQPCHNCESYEHSRDQCPLCYRCKSFSHPYTRCWSDPKSKEDDALLIQKADGTLALKSIPPLVLTSLAPITEEKSAERKLHEEVKKLADEFPILCTLKKRPNITTPATAKKQSKKYKSLCLHCHEIGHKAIECPSKICWRCNGRSHHESECYLNPNASPYAHVCPDGVSTRCQLCMGVGHTKKDCHIYELK